MPASLRAGLQRAVRPPVQMALGLGVFGLAGYVYVAVTGAALADSEANLAIAFYFIVNVVGPGVFYALEQVTSRATSSARAAGHPLSAALRRAGSAGAGLVATVMAGLLLLAPVLGGITLHDDWRLYAQVLATPVIAGALHLVRGQLGGLQRFSGYAMTLAIEGVARIALSLLLALAGVDDAWLYGIAYLGGSVLAILAGLALLRRGERGRSARASHGSADEARDAPVPGSGPGVGKGLAALAVANLFAQLLPNLAPLAVASRLAEDSAVALAFGQAVVIARIPMLLFFPVQTMLLPSLSSAVTKGEFRAVARLTNVVMLAVGAFGAAWTVLFVTLGPWVLRTFLGTTAALDTVIMFLLPVSTIVIIWAAAVQPALLALHRDHIVSGAWAIGSAVTLGLVLLPGDPVVAATVAQLVGPGLTLLVGVLALRSGLLARASRQPASTG